VESADVHDPGDRLGDEKLIVDVAGLVPRGTESGTPSERLDRRNDSSRLGFPRNWSVAGAETDD
jgi:hypothetical protein